MGRDVKSVDVEARMRCLKAPKRWRADEEEDGRRGGGGVEQRRVERLRRECH